MELKLEDQGQNTILYCVAFTDIESLIGDVVCAWEHRVRCQPLVRWPGWWSYPIPVPRCRFHGQRTTFDCARTANPENTVLTPAGVAIGRDGIEIMRKPGKSYDFVIMDFMDSNPTSLVWFLCFSTSETNCTLELRYYAIDVILRCVCLLPHAIQWRLPLKRDGHVQSVSCRTRNSGACRWRTHPSHKLKVNEFVDVANHWICVAVQWVSAQNCVEWPAARLRLGRWVGGCITRWLRWWFSDSHPWADNVQTFELPDDFIIVEMTRWVEAEWERWIDSLVCAGVGRFGVFLTLVNWCLKDRFSFSNVNVSSAAVYSICAVFALSQLKHGRFSVREFIHDDGWPEEMDSDLRIQGVMTTLTTSLARRVHLASDTVATNDSGNLWIPG